jgi:hypothetical protein
MKITASQLRKIIKEEVKNATLTVEASSNDTYMKVQDVENGKEYSVLVQEGTTPYSVSISFGNSFSINLNTEDARDLCDAIAKASVEI